MRSLFEKVIFISNSELSEQYQQQLVDFVDEFIQRENKGFDFAAWRDGMEQVGFDQLKMYDSVTLMNDTCFGPLYEMAPIYEKYEIQNIDFWGITNHRAYHESKNISMSIFSLITKYSTIMLLIHRSLKIFGKILLIIRMFKMLLTITKFNLQKFLWMLGLNMNLFLIQGL